MKRKSPRLGQHLSLCLFLGAFQSATAIEYTWTGGGLDNNWNNVANWNALPIPADTADLLFTGTTRLTSNNNFSIGTNGTAINDITFAAGAGAFTLTGNRVDLRYNEAPGAKITNNSSNLQTFNLDINVPGVREFATNGNGGDLLINGMIRSSGATGGIVKNGLGTLSLSVENTYEGNTTINAGVLSIRHSNALGATINGTTINSGGTLQLQGGITVPENITLSNSTSVINGSLIENLSGNNTLSGTISRNGGIFMTSTAGKLTVNSDIAGTDNSINLQGAGNGELTGNITLAFSINKTGTGTWTLSGNASTHTGTTSAIEGNLLATKAASLSGYNVAGKTIFSGGILGVQVGGSGWSTAEVDTLLANSTKTSGSLGIDTTNGSLSQWTLFTTATFGSNIGLSKLGANNLTLDQANTFQGMTRAVAGSLTISHAQGIQNSILNMDAADTGTITFGQDSTLGGLSGSRNLDMGGRALSIGNRAVNTVYSGSLDNGSLIKVGSATLALSGPNTYVGDTTVDTGILNIRHNTALGTTAGNTLVRTAARLQIEGDGLNIAENIVFGESSNGAALENVSGNNTLSGNISRNGVLNIFSTSGKLTIEGGISGTANTLRVQGAGDGEIKGDVSSAFQIDKTGTGTWTLTGDNTHTGATVVSDGKLVINGANNTTSMVTVNSGGALAGTGSVGGATTLSGVLAPGNSIGTFTVNNDATWNSGNAWEFELGTSAASLILANTLSTQDLLMIAGANSDFLRGTDTGGAFIFDFEGTGEQGWYKLVDWQGTTTFSDPTDFQATNLASGLTGSFAIDPTTSALYLNVIPEPSSSMLLGTFALLAAFSRRRGGM